MWSCSHPLPMPSREPQPPAPPLPVLPGPKAMTGASIHQTPRTGWRTNAELERRNALLSARVAGLEGKLAKHVKEPDVRAYYDARAATENQALEEAKRALVTAARFERPAFRSGVRF